MINPREVYRHQYPEPGTPRREIPLKNNPPMCDMCRTVPSVARIAEIYNFDLCLSCFEQGLPDEEWAHAEGLGHGLVSIWYDEEVREKYKDHVVAI